MKALFTLLLLTISISAFAQSSDTTWFSKKWEKTNKQNSYYYRVVQSGTPDSLLHVKDYFGIGELQMEGSYTSLTPEIKEGTFIWWHKNGVKQRECLFKDNTMVNLTEWDAQGKMTSHKEFVNVVKYVNGAPAYEAKYVEATPKFPGESGITAYLKSNIKYPDEAAKDGIGGKVIVGFVVTKKGKIKHVEIVQGVHPAIDTEAIRVVKAMSDWTPGRSEGKPIDIKMNLPINFNPS